MDDIEIITTIAGWQGWKWYRRPATGPWANNPMRCLYNPNLVPETVATMQLADMTERECNWEFIQREGKIQDYVNSLNAIVDVVCALTDDQYEQYLSQLIKECGGNPNYGWTFRPVTEATARQRATALAKWIKAQPKPQ